MPYLAQSLFGHGTAPPYWCLHEWKVAADFAVACKQRPTLHWSPQTWATASNQPPTDVPISPYAVLPVPAHITDGLPAELTDGLPTSPPIGAEAVHVYGTGLDGGLPHDLPVGQNHVTFHLRGAYGPSMSQMFAEKYCTDDGWRRLPRAPLRSHAEYLEFCRCLLDDDGH